MGGVTRLSRNQTTRVAGLLLLACGACRSSDPDLEPLTPEELAERDLSLPPNLGVIDDPGTLFVTLDQNLRSWRALKLSSEAKAKLQIESLEEALTRLVYRNFDVILETLKEGEAEQRVTAAAALGFSKIPAPDEAGGDPEFPPVHPRAIAPLLEVLEEGNDELTQNGLLAISRIGNPSVPVDLLLELLLTHHSPAVRGNAALALATVLRPGHRDLALSSLYAALEDEDQKVRLHTLTALARLSVPSSAGQVLGIFTDDESPLVRANAAFVLGQLGDDDVVPYLIQGMSSPSAVVRFYSWNALQAITGEDQGEDPEAWLTWYREMVADRGP